MKDNNSYKLNRMQKNIFNVCQLGVNTAVGNQGGYLFFEEELDIDRLSEAAYVVMNRPDIMRLRMNSQKEFYIASYCEYKKGMVPYLWVSNKQEAEDKAKEELSTCRLHPHNALQHVFIVECEEGLYLCGVMHHLLVDGYSIVQIMKLIVELYDVLEQGGEQEWILKKEKIFQGFVSADSEGLKEQEIKHNAQSSQWFSQMKDLPECEWKIKNQGLCLEADELAYVLDSDLTEKLRTFAKQTKQTMDTIITATVYSFVSLFTASSQVVLSRTFLNRTKETLNVIGMYTNTLPCPVEIDDNMRFLELCDALAQQQFEMMKWAGYSFYDLQRSLDRKDIPYDVAVCYNSERFLPKMKRGERHDLYCGYNDIPLRIQIFDGKERILFRMQYQTGCYEPREIEGIFRGISYLLEQSMDNPVITTMNLVAATESSLVSKMDIPYDYDREIHPIWRMFLNQVEQHGDEIAVVWKRQGVCHELTYKQAEYIVRKIAYGLQCHRIHKGKLVGIKLDRSEPISLVILAAFAVGAGFLLISNKDAQEQYRKQADRCDIIVDVAFVQEVWESEEMLEAECYVGKSDVAYVIRTSGTTGEPKYTRISVGALYTRLMWHIHEFGMEPVVLQKTRISFDVSVWELLYSFVAGGRMAILPEEEELNLVNIAKVIREEQITHIHFVPSVLELFLKQLKESVLDTVKVVICSGETFLTSLSRKAIERFPNAKIYNLYGPAECTIDVSWYLCTGDEETLPIGKPVWNTGLDVVSEEGKVLPKGMEGEIRISGELVGIGYDSEDSKNAFRTIDGIPYYYTGDKGFIASDGNLYFTGRKDRQVKLHGQRIDLSGLEAVAMCYEGMEQAFAEIENRRLVLFCAGVYEDRELLELLKRKLPYYSIPAEIVRVEQIYLTANGKLDRKRIKQEAGAKLSAENQKVLSDESAQHKELAGRIQHKLQKMLGQQLQLSEDLLEAGMDSLSIMELIVWLTDEGFQLSLVDFYREPTIINIVRLLLGEVSDRPVGKELYILVPYAGGGGESFHSLIKELKDADIRIVSFDSFPVWSNEENVWLEQWKKEIDVDTYQCIHIIGNCVGSALAIRLYDILSRAGYQTGNLVFCGALPYEGRMKGSNTKIMWDYIPDTVLKHCFIPELSRIFPMQGDVVERFRQDVRSSCYLLKQSREKIQIASGYRCIMIFGSEDLYTVRYQRRYGKWSKYIKGKVQVHTIKKAGHYMIRTHAKEVLKCILN